jgi:hypothetical protein
MELQLEGASALSRRRFVQTAAVAAAGVTGSLAWPARAAATDEGDSRGVVPPKPIPGGIQIPNGPQIHVWQAGDPSVTLPFSGATLMGFDVEPSTITDRRGFSALAYHAGTATGSDGATYDLETDIRAFAVTYVASDGAPFREVRAYMSGPVRAQFGLARAQAGAGLKRRDPRLGSVLDPAHQ